TGNLVQKALDGVSLNLRDNEFVAILGPSGSGKTTLLNIIGGLDRYDSGDVIINGISTKKYKDRDWDSYRNHTIGFVFQSYNLIPHQTVLANVELALTISGIGKAERRERAVKALEEVGLGNQLHKKPNQMSGGQMQRVAIARALVNDPDILLADEPTGALDSDTSVQVMDLLREVAKDRLVVMVTHNPELAEQYATRIVKLRDGKIRSDSDPFLVEEGTQAEPQHKNMGKSSMSFLTALSLSFNNLKTKKARTLLTSFAGSIGIIGIALILALSTGVNAYIQTVEEETLSEYPLQIQSTGLDFSSMISDGGGGAEDGGQVEEGEINVIQMVSNMFSTMDSNDLASLKTYLENGDSGIEKYTNAVEYSYSVTPQIYRQDVDGIRQVNPDTSFDALGLGSSSGSNSMMSSIMSTDVFYEMPENAGLYESQYDVKAGRWPENYNECVLVLTSGGGISDFLLYTLGLRDSMELDEMIQQFIDEENIDTPENMGSYSYDDIIGITFKLVNSAEYYEYDSQYQVWRDKTDDEEYMKNLVKNGEDITIVGVVQPSEDANGLLLNTGICYPSSLTEHVAEEAEDSEIVQRQLADKDINVFTGEAFGEQSSNSEFDTNSLFTIDAEKLQNAFTFDSSGLAGGLDGAFDLSSLGSLSGGSLNLSEMIDLSDIQLTLPEAPSISMSDIMDNIEITASSEDLGQMVSGLLEGYQEYSAQNPQADYSRLGEYFLQYLQTPEAQKILEDNIRDIIESGADLTVSIEELQQLVRDVMAGYQEYALENGYTDPDRFDEYLVEYLQTPEAQAVLTQWASNAIGDIGDVAITEDQLKKLASELAAGYQSYAAANGLPDPSRMGEYFLDYLGTDDAKQKLAAGIAAMVDTGSLESQISASIQSYMGQVMSSLSGEMVQSLETQITSAMTQVMNQISAGMESAMEQAVTRLGTNMENAMSIDSDAFADAFTMNMSGDELAELMMSMNSTENATYENNLRTLGYVDFDVPSGIDIYPIDFESKEQVVRILDDYNSRMEAEGKDEQVITYTDMVGTLMSSVTDIIDIISYVLIAFVAISLVVSSIMIGVITYISVLERKKEIGILRAIGASKGNISQVFNAETFIIGLCAGLIGIGLSLLLLIPGNALIHYLAGTDDVSAVLPAGPAVVLILLSVVLTLIGGIIPSRKAAKSDPVAALRTE
ncbi:MAG TPA: ABC transporter ATP-binding protein/permease, partial [Candidatus Mediterraneibacter faecigallinarum]|nr:ABC transporter ATP-binding protein/permease [Candidatus Mediterraneibacter faecigallinarum]